MSGHTKGPLTVCAGRNGSNYTHVRTPALSGPLAAFVKRDDAVLFAAAPDMLKALESAMVTLPLAPCFCAESFVCSRCLAMEQARVSIAKATGGAA